MRLRFGLLVPKPCHHQLQEWCLNADRFVLRLGLTCTAGLTELYLARPHLADDFANQLVFDGYRIIRGGEAR
jgi:hypothetical protein